MTVAVANEEGRASKVLIAGAGGLVGRHLARRLAARYEVLALKHSDLDITDRAAVWRLIESERPDLVVNCAVLGVDECERDPDAAHALNVEGPRALAEAAGPVGADVLHFSTNYVFDGRAEGREPYTQEDEPRPLNVYGRTKLEGERAVRAASMQSFVVRTSWVYGRGKESFLSTAYARLAAGQAVRAIVNTWANTTYVEDLVTRVEEILAGRVYGVYHVVNEGVCSYYDFAVEAARLAGLNESDAARLVETVREEEMRREAERPRYTPMRCLLSEGLGLAPLRHWRDALAAFVAA
ncbi:MAG TPA: dTDP-4-dehydrorhamnose reductase [Pyrinomonadaceae bacterium]|nr:dTDP-4-dehydrorhamnose reductase [Pyrinomonadaceae bacterium]